MDDSRAKLEAFKRYQIKGYEFSESTEEISFSIKQKDLRRYKILVIACAVFAVLPMIVLWATARHRVEGAFAGLLMMPFAGLIATIIAIPFGIFWVRRRGTVIIQKGKVIIDMVETKSTILVNDIQGVSVGQDDYVIIWDQGIPVPALKTGGLETAQTLVIGIKAAIGVVNPDWQAKK